MGCQYMEIQGPKMKEFCQKCWYRIMRFIDGGMAISRSMCGVFVRLNDFAVYSCLVE